MIAGNGEKARDSPLDFSVVVVVDDDDGDDEEEEDDDIFLANRKENSNKVFLITINLWLIPESIVIAVIVRENGSGKGQDAEPR